MSESPMLGLRLPTDPRWVKVAEKNLTEVLSDHAWCEQKAASNAISTMVRFHDYPDVVDEMVRISLEELTHFRMVVEKIRERNLELKADPKDPYVKDLRLHILKGGNREIQLVEALLLAAMIEARSCERFRILSEELEDPDLQRFYRELMISEADHYTTFLSLARKNGPNLDVDARWQAFLDYEGGLMEKYGKEGSMHG